nr:hypothetical protein [Tanacetum cinerariifolium]
MSMHGLNTLSSFPKENDNKVAISDDLDDSSANEPRASSSKPNLQIFFITDNSATYHHVIGATWQMGPIPGQLPRQQVTWIIQKEHSTDSNPGPPDPASSKISDSHLEEFTDELALLDPFLSRNKDDNFDPEADLREIEYLLNRDSSTDSSPKTDIDIIDPILERFTNEPDLVYSFILGDDDDDLFDFKSDNEKLKKLLYGDLFDNTHSENEKDKDLKIESLNDDMDDDFFPLLPTSDSTQPEESSKSSEIATLLSFSFGNEDKVFNPCILILGGTQIFHKESKDKDLKVNSSTEALLILVENNFLSHSSDRSSDRELLFFLESTISHKESKDKDLKVNSSTEALLILVENNFLSYSSDRSSDRELLFFLESTVIDTLLSFSSGNKDKVFNPGILISKGVHSFTLGLTHRTYETFKIVNVHPNILNESPMKIFLFFCFYPKDKGTQGESS